MIMQGTDAANVCHTKAGKLNFRPMSQTLGQKVDEEIGRLSTAVDREKERGNDWLQDHAIVTAERDGLAARLQTVTVERDEARASAAESSRIINRLSDRITPQPAILFADPASRVEIETLTKERNALQVRNENQRRSILSFLKERDEAATELETERGETAIVINERDQAREKLEAIQNSSALVAELRKVKAEREAMKKGLDEVLDMARARYIEIGRLSALLDTTITERDNCRQRIADLMEEKIALAAELRVANNKLEENEAILADTRYALNQSNGVAHIRFDEIQKLRAELSTNDALLNPILGHVRFLLSTHTRSPAPGHFTNVLIGAIPAPWDHDSYIAAWRALHQMVITPATDKKAEPA